jgi:predicted ATP-grasp superfamily ATP-dependent carboligase
VKILVTSARLPHALGVIRKFGEQGHQIYATDTFTTSPGLHSSHVKEAIITASPKFDTRRFLDEVKDIIRSRCIDLVVPCFEEVFYLAKHRDEIAALTRVFFPPFDTLARLHNKETFTALTQQLKLPIASTRVARSPEELAAATQEFKQYFARAAFSRGGVELLTNTGPLAGQVKLEDCHPSAENPWLVQEFVQGKDICSFSVAHEGRLAAHCTYEHPLTIEHAGGIVFESIDEPESVQIAKTFIEATGYNGHISFDYIKTDNGLSIVECNPRPTAGIFMMPATDYVSAVFTPDPAHPAVVEPGAREQIDSAILRDMFREPKDFPSDMKLLLSGTQDVYAQKGDRLPGIYQILSYSHVFAFRHRMHVRKHKHSDLMEAQFFDIDWDGGTIQ